MFQAKFDEAKYLTLGVGAVNVTFTLVAVSTKSSGLHLSSQITLKVILLKNNNIILTLLYWLLNIISRSVNIECTKILSK